jgi:hypothetical protein
MVATVQMSIKPATGHERRESSGNFLTALAVATILAIAFLEWLAWLSGATWTPTMMARKQFDDPSTLVLPNDLRYFAPLKLAHIAIAQPEIVFLGSSRCNELRSAMFRPYSFYNACLSAWTLPQFVRMFDLMTKVSHPRVVMFSMDYFQFSDIYAAAEAKRKADFSEGFGFHIASLNTLFSAIADPAAPTRWHLLDYFKGERYREATDDMTLLGISADRAVAGFRFDGSFLYQRPLIVSAPEHNEDVHYGLLVGVPGAPHVTETQMANLRELAELAAARNVKLVGIQLPILGTVVDYLDHDQSYWDYSGVWREFAGAKVQSEIRSYGVSFFDLSRSAVTKDSRHFIDPAHPNETGMLGALVELLENPEFASVVPKIDPQALRQEYADAVNNQQYFDLYRKRF